MKRIYEDILDDMSAIKSDYSGLIDDTDDKDINKFEHRFEFYMHTEKYSRDEIEHRLTTILESSRCVEDYSDVVFEEPPEHLRNYLDRVNVYFGITFKQPYKLRNVINLFYMIAKTFNYYDNMLAAGRAPEEDDSDDFIDFREWICMKDIVTICEFKYKGLTGDIKDKMTKFAGWLPDATAPVDYDIDDVFDALYARICKNADRWNEKCVNAPHYEDIIS